MKYSAILILLSLTTTLIGQRTADLKISESVSESDLSCFDLQLNYTGDDVAIASQNYRIFYNAEAFKFKEEKASIYLPADQYTFNIVQHNAGVDASGVGKLSFENHLGFINATLIFNDPRSIGFRLVEDGNWQSIIQLCFEDLVNEADQQIILAREELTSSYGRAFVELSIAEKSGSISALDINNYFDLK